MKVFWFRYLKTVFCISIFAILNFKVAAQPPFLQGLTQNPNSHAELTSSNGILARGYAPVLHQFVSAYPPVRIVLSSQKLNG